MGNTTEDLSLSGRLIGHRGPRAPSGLARKAVHAAISGERLVEAGVYEHTRLPHGRFGAQGQPAAWVTDQAHTAPLVSREPNNRHASVSVLSGRDAGSTEWRSILQRPRAAHRWSPLTALRGTEAECDLRGLSGSRLVPGVSLIVCGKALLSAPSWSQFMSVIV